MNNINRERIGSKFDDFLKENNSFEEVSAIARKRLLAEQIKQAMINKSVTKVQIAKEMKTSRSAIDRLLDPKNASITLDTIDRVANVLGMRLNISLS